MRFRFTWGYADWQGLRRRMCGYAERRAANGGGYAAADRGCAAGGQGLKPALFPNPHWSGVVVLLVIVIASRNLIASKAGGSATFSVRKTTANAIPNTCRLFL